MKYSKTPIALAAFSLFAGAPVAAHAVTVYFKAPSSGITLRNVTWNNSSACEVAGDDIRRVQFVLINSSGQSTTLNTDTSAPWRCNLDSTDFANGKYTVRAFAYDSAGRQAISSRSLTISNSTSDAKPTISFSAPGNNATISTTTTCRVNAADDRGVRQVQFYVDGKLLSTDTSSSYTCSLNNKSYTNGAHTLKAVVTDSANQTAETQITFNVTGGISTTPTNTPPTVSIDSPASGTKLAGTSTPFAVTAKDNVAVAKVDVYLQSGSTQKLVASKTAAPYSGTIATTGLPNGTATLMAVATDNAGAQSTVQRSVTIDNTVSTPPGGGGGTSPVDPAHILSRASADLPFSSQSGYSAQVIGSHTSANSIPETGINGSTLSNGERLRLGKVADPSNGSRKALQFQVDPSDPTTSGGKRSELSMNPNIEMGKVYWMAVSAYVHNWGTLSDADNALFGMQMHSGDNSRGLSPSFGIYTTNGGRNFKVMARWSTSNDPQQGNSEKANYADQPIPFGRWVDFVLKFKHATNGGGFMQVWMDGQQIVNHVGNLGFNTPGFKDYAKFGYYNWSGSSMSSTRKVLLRSPTVVADPSGSTYSAEQVRTLLGDSATSSAGTTQPSGGTSTAGTAPTGGTTTGATTTGSAGPVADSGSGVCSTASCVLGQ